MNKAWISSNVALGKFFADLSNNHKFFVVQALRQEVNKTFVPFFLLPKLGRKGLVQLEVSVIIAVKRPRTSANELITSI